jgi:NAD(P)-dependent dehydrogenase (short-subunit alcohol dehydrogenase family)
MNMGALEGKVALVTGAAQGLGRASASVFAREGARVVVVDINRDGGQETVGLIKNAGGDATFVEADVSKSPKVQAMVQAAVDAYGGLDCAHNNAAVSLPPHPLAEVPEEDWIRGIAVDLTSVFLGMKYEVPAMLERGGGAIVNTASAGGAVAVPGGATYIAAKYGIIGLTKVAALDYGARGIRVNAISPGAMWTPMMRARAATEPGHLDHLTAMHPIGRLAEPEEVAEAAVWLCTDAASFVLGHTLSVDGGYVIH